MDRGKIKQGMKLISRQLQNKTSKPDHPKPSTQTAGQKKADNTSLPVELVEKIVRFSLQDSIDRQDFDAVKKLRSSSKGLDRMVRNDPHYPEAQQISHNKALKIGRLAADILTGTVEMKSMSSQQRQLLESATWIALPTRGIWVATQGTGSQTREIPSPALGDPRLTDAVICQRLVKVLASMKNVQNIDIETLHIANPQNFRIPPKLFRRLTSITLPRSSSVLWQDWVDWLVDAVETSAEGLLRTKPIMLEELTIRDGSYANWQAHTKALSQLSHLKALTLNRMGISYLDLRDLLPAFSKLERVDLSHNALSGATIAKLATSGRALVSLDLAHNKELCIPKPESELFSSLGKLQNLNLSETPIDDEWLELSGLFTCANLRTLDLFGTSISLQGALKLLSKLPALERLHTSLFPGEEDLIASSTSARSSFSAAEELRDEKIILTFKRRNS